MCFVNAVWQMLLLVPQLVHVLRTVSIAGAADVHDDGDGDGDGNGDGDDCGAGAGDAYCRFKSSTFISANRYFSLGQPFPSSLPVLLSVAHARLMIVVSIVV
jgi:hypothetical protein